MTRSGDAGLPYPREQETDILLRDGSTAHVRPVRHDDSDAIRSFLETVSADSIAFRFFGTPRPEWIVSWSIDVDYADRFALVAETGSPRRVVAHAAYIRDRGDRAEVAFLVADAWQGRGISTVLMAHLAEIAERHGIATFTAEVLPINHRMIGVFRESGFPVDLRSTPDAIHVEFPTSLSAAALARFDERERIAAIAAVRSVLEPRSVAVLGASRRRGTVGGEILHNLLGSGFVGPVYPVNVQADVVQSIRAYASIADIPDKVDLAVVVVPAAAVLDAARDCAESGVRALVVISAGFAEAGEVGAERQTELLAVCRGAGMRLVGPNCLGVLNTASDVQMNATFAGHAPAPGGVGFMSQSGGVGIAIMAAATQLGVGLSSFVSVGNKADLSGNDFLRYWEEDPNTDVALMYLESFGNPRKFARIAPRFARRKPLLAVKSGRTAAGARATSSHTGALLSASDVTVDALFEQAGVIRADSLHELFGVASLLSSQPVPRGDRVAIVTNAGGPGIMCADACQAYGVDVPALAADVQGRLAEFLHAEASLQNPVDMIATASAEDYARVMRTLIEADACDAIVAIFVPPLVTVAVHVAQAIQEVADSRPAVAMAAVFMTGAGPPGELGGDGVRVPGYEYPEEAARAVALAAKYGRWRARPEPSSAPVDIGHADRAAAVISSALARGVDWLSPMEVVSLLQCYGLPLVETRLVADPDAAAAVAAELGCPVALKASADRLIHKSDAGGVRVGLQDTAQVRQAAQEMQAALTQAGFELDGFIVQPMAPAGVELIVGVAGDPSFGPVLACGAGGTLAELTKDIAVRLTPIDPGDASEMIRSLRSFPLLDGYRGTPRCDVAGIEDVLMRVSAMVEAHREIVELDCNPLIARADGVLIVDARVRVEPSAAPAPIASIRG
jgi:acetate---CoA ligase (ADP-forming)